MRGLAGGRRVAVSQHVRHSGTQDAGVALPESLPRRGGGPPGLHPHRRVDAGQLHHIPALLAARPAAAQNPLHRPRIPRAAQSGAHSRHSLGVVRHLRLQGRKAGAEDRERPRRRRRGGHRLLEPQQPGVDLPHGGRAAHDRRAGHAVRRHRHRGPRLPLHGFPQTVGTAFRSPLPGFGGPLHGQLHPAGLRVEDIQLRRTANRRGGDLRRAFPPRVPRPAPALQHRTAGRRLRTGLSLCSLVRHEPFGAARPGGNVPRGGRRRTGLRGRSLGVRPARPADQGDVPPPRIPHRLRQGPRRAGQRRILLHGRLRRDDQRRTVERAAALRHLRHLAHLDRQPPERHPRLRLADEPPRTVRNARRTFNRFCRK